MAAAKAAFFVGLLILHSPDSDSSYGSAQTSSTQKSVSKIIDLPKPPDFSQVREHLAAGNVLEDHVQVGVVLQWGKERRRLYKQTEQTEGRSSSTSRFVAAAVVVHSSGNFGGGGGRRIRISERTFD